MTKIFVGNLSFGATEDTIRSLFESHGTVDTVSLITDRDTGRARGFAFVEMSDSGAAEKAIAGLNGSDLAGRTLQVNEARPKVERPRGNFGQSFGRSGGGGRRNDRRGSRQPREPRW